MTTWTEIKRKRNITKHGVDLAMADDFEFDAAIVREDADEAYGEQRFVAIGPIRNILYVYVFTQNRDGSEHAISLRLAEPKERRFYAREI